MPQLTVGVIGYRNHSAKLISLINQKKYVGKIISYCYKKNFLKHLNKKKKFKKISFTSNLEDLDTCDSIVISSSTGSHINYIKKFIKKY